MDKEFVTYQLEIKLKELGFKYDCLGFYYSNQTFGYHPDSDAFADAPLWQQAFDWFEEKHKIEGIVKSWKEGNDNYFYYSVNKLFSASHYQMKYTTRLQAKIACLEKLIETTTV